MEKLLEKIIDIIPYNTIIFYAIILNIIAVLLELFGIDCFGGFIRSASIIFILIFEWLYTKEETN